MMKIPQTSRIETFLEGVTDKNTVTGLPIFKELVEVSGVISVISVYL